MVVLGAITLVLLAMTAAGIWLTPQVLASVWPAATNRASNYPQQLLADSKKGAIPVIGDEGRSVQARVMLVQHRGGRTYLADPFTGQLIRTATAAEAEEIGSHAFALEWFSRPADHQLVLTFDDGPDPQNTPQILDILAREHVPATFFVIGENVLAHPGLLQQEIQAGNVVGQHTVTHPGSTRGSVIDREEMVGADRLIRAAAGYGTRLFRMPFGDPGRNPLTVLEAQQLGYADVLWDLDTNDWSYQPGQSVPLPELDGRGHVVLMHDGGGSRAPTIELLQRMIAEAKAQGYTFTTVTSVLPASFAPEAVVPSLPDRTTWSGLWAVMVMPVKLVGWLFWFGVSSLLAMSLITVALALANQRARNRRRWPDTERTPLSVSVLLPVYNEEKVLAKTLCALARSEYPDFEVVAVDDGSTDDTWGVLTAFASV